MSDWLALWEDAMRRAREAPSVPVALCDIVAPELRRIQDTAKRYVHVITAESGTKKPTIRHSKQRDGSRCFKINGLHLTMLPKDAEKRRLLRRAQHNWALLLPVIVDYSDTILLLPRLVIEVADQVFGVTVSHGDEAEVIYGYNEALGAACSLNDAISQIMENCANVFNIEAAPWPSGRGRSVNLAFGSRVKVFRLTDGKFVVGTSLYELAAALPCALSEFNTIVQLRYELLMNSSDLVPVLDDLLQDEKRLEVLTNRHDGQLRSLRECVGLLAERQKVIARQCDEMSEQKINSMIQDRTLSRFVHSHGLNMRFLGAIRKHCNNSCSAKAILAEMVLRCIKDIVRQALTTTSPISPALFLHHHDCRNIIAEQLQIIFGAGEASDVLWTRTIHSHLARKFEEDCRGCPSDLRNYVDVKNLLAPVAVDLGIQLSEHTVVIVRACPVAQLQFGPSDISDFKVSVYDGAFGALVERIAPLHGALYIIGNSVESESHSQVRNMLSTAEQNLKNLVVERGGCDWISQLCLAETLLVEVAVGEATLRPQRLQSTVELLTACSRANPAHAGTAKLHCKALVQRALFFDDDQFKETVVDTVGKAVTDGHCDENSVLEWSDLCWLRSQECSKQNADSWAHMSGELYSIWMSNWKTDLKEAMQWSTKEDYGTVFALQREDSEEMNLSSYPYLSEDVFEKMLQLRPKLTGCNLKGMQKIGPQQLSLLISLHSSSLNSLSLGTHTKISPAQAMRAAISLQHLQTLSIERTSPTWDGLSDDHLLLAAPLLTSLSSLSLRGNCRIRDPSLQLLLSNCTSLVALDVSGCDLVSDESIKRLCRTSTCLEVLKMKGCKLLTDECILELAVRPLGTWNIDRHQWFPSIEDLILFKQGDRERLRGVKLVELWEQVKSPSKRAMRLQERERGKVRFKFEEDSGGNALADDDTLASRPATRATLKDSEPGPGDKFSDAKSAKTESSAGLALEAHLRLEGREEISNLLCSIRVIEAHLKGKVIRGDGALSVRVVLHSVVCKTAPKPAGKRPEWYEKLEVTKLRDYEDADPLSLQELQIEIQQTTDIGHQRTAAHTKIPLPSACGGETTVLDRWMPAVWIPLDVFRGKDRDKEKQTKKEPATEHFAGFKKEKTEAEVEAEMIQKEIERQKKSRLGPQGGDGGKIRLQVFIATPRGLKEARDRELAEERAAAKRAAAAKRNPFVARQQREEKAEGVIAGIENKMMEQLVAAACDECCGFTSTKPEVFGSFERSIPHLFEIDISGCGLLSDSAFRELFYSYPMLRVVRADRAKGMNEVALMGIAKYCKSLQELSIKGCFAATGTGVCNVVINCRGLRKLNVSECVDLSDAPLVKVGEAMVMEHLQVAGLKLISDGALASVMRCPLTTLNLSGLIQLSENALLQIGRFGQHLESLNISFCNASDLVIKEIAVGCPKLIKIDISHCTRCGDAAINALASTVPGLQHVMLTGLPRLTDEGINVVMSCLRGLQQLSISLCNGITDIALERIAAAGGALRHVDCMGLSLNPFITEKQLKMLRLALPDCIFVTETGSESLEMLIADRAVTRRPTGELEQGAEVMALRRGKDHKDWEAATVIRIQVSALSLHLPRASEDDHVQRDTPASEVDAYIKSSCGQSNSSAIPDDYGEAES